MGTNYYIEDPCANPCAHCQPHPLHIGKTSVGWRFLANADDMETRSWTELRTRLTDATIVDEYGERVADLVSAIEGRAHLKPHSDTEYPHWMTRRFDSSDGPVDFTEGGFS